MSRLIFLGSGEFAVCTLEALRAAGHEIARVVTQPDRPRGRGRKPAPTPVKRAAEALGLAVLCTSNVNEEAIADRLFEAGAELGVVVAFGQKIAPRLLGGFRGGLINLHASLLPRHRGAAPVNWSILAGDAVTGVTVFRLTERMDAGPILAQRETVIEPLETAGELHDRLSHIGAEAVLAVVAAFDEGRVLEGRPQEEALATKAPKLRKEDGSLDFRQSAMELSRRVRGLWPWPGARCRFRSADGAREEVVTLARADADAAPAECPPGMVTSDLRVATGAGRLGVLALQPAGGKLMSWLAFVNGRHVQAGDTFAPPA